MEDTRKYFKSYESAINAYKEIDSNTAIICLFKVPWLKHQNILDSKLAQSKSWLRFRSSERVTSELNSEN